MDELTMIYVRVSWELRNARASSSNCLLGSGQLLLFACTRQMYEAITIVRHKAVTVYRGVDGYCCLLDV